MEERGETHGLAGGEDFTGHVREDGSIGERIADTGRCLHMGVDNTPAAVRTAGKVGREELDAAAGWLDPLAGAQIGRIGEHQLRRNEPQFQRLLGAVDIGEHRLVQPRALHHRRFDPAPVRRRHDQRDEIQMPRLQVPRRIGEWVVGDTGLAHARVDAVDALKPFAVGKALQAVEHRLPVRAHPATGTDEFVVGPGRRIAGDQGRCCR